MIYTLFLVAAMLAVALNVFATLLIVRSDRYDTPQKCYQAALVWLIPVIGAVLVWSLAKDPPAERVSTDLRDRLGGQGSYENTSSADVGSGDGGGGGGGE